MSAGLVCRTARADGYRCEGEGYHIQLYNSVQSLSETDAPAAMIVSEDGWGTLAVIPADQLSTDDDDMDDNHGQVYEGETNSKVDGHFLSVRLEIKDNGVETRDGIGYGGTFTMNWDHEQVVKAMRCSPYLSKH